jgi:Uma2 family endonuclease
MVHAYLPYSSKAEQIMSMPVSAINRRYTEAEFYEERDAAPYGQRWELVDGEVLVTPAPHWNHQQTMLHLTILLHDYVRAQSLGMTLPSPLDVRLEPGLVMQPDIVVVPAGHLRTMNDSVSKLLLAVEVVSRSSARFDRVVKRPRYQRNRVSEYWIVDNASQLIERWQPDDERPAILTEQLTWLPEGATKPFELDVRAFFVEVVPPQS